MKWQKHCKSFKEQKWKVRQACTLFADSLVLNYLKKTTSIAAGAMSRQAGTGKRRYCPSACGQKSILWNVGEISKQPDSHTNSRKKAIVFMQKVALGDESTPITE